ncbi:MAG: hypothetical protein AB1589_44880 [Cyanobacteriota bacterium]
MEFVMGEAKRRKQLDPSYGKPNKSRPDARRPEWVCNFGNDYLALDTLDKCLDCYAAVEGIERQRARQACLLTGYCEGDVWTIQWDVERAVKLRQTFAFYLSKDGTLAIAP